MVRPVVLFKQDISWLFPAHCVCCLAVQRHTRLVGAGFSQERWWGIAPALKIEEHNLNRTYCARVLQ